MRHDNRRAGRLKWPIRIMIVLAVAVLILLAGDFEFEYRDEVAYRYTGQVADGDISVNLQNTGSTATYSPLFAIRRYGSPFNLIIELTLPSTSPATGAELQNVEVISGQTRLVQIRTVELPIELVEQIQPARKTMKQVSYMTKPFAASESVLVVAGTLVLHQPEGDRRMPFRREFRRQKQRGFSRGA